MKVDKIPLQAPKVDVERISRKPRLCVIEEETKQSAAHHHSLADQRMLNKIKKPKRTDEEADNDN